jgi:hypothetical protein
MYTDDWSRQIVGLAATILRKAGRALYPVEPYGWDIEHPDGSWGAVNSPAELMTEARRVALILPAPP